MNPDGSTGLCWLQVAIKDPFDQYPSRVLTERFLREVSASRNVLHNNVAGLVGACMVAGSVSVVYEWVPYSCLRDALDQNSLSGVCAFHRFLVPTLKFALKLDILTLDSFICI